MSVQQPSIGRIVHYVSYGTPGGEYKSQCRAAVITEVTSAGVVGLCVLNPEGQFFNRGVSYHDGSGQPGDPKCPNQPHEDKPFRYCGCGWSEPHHKGGTWHWPERV